MPRPSHYATPIRETAARLGHVGVDPRWIEGYMRLAHSTLDGLSPAEFTREVSLSIECVRVAGTEEAEALALSYGL